jgi:hypothetical protein
LQVLGETWETVPLCLKARPQFTAAVHRQFFEDAFEMLLHRLRRDAERVRDLLAARSGEHAQHDTFFTVRECVGGEQKWNQFLVARGFDHKSDVVGIRSARQARGRNSDPPARSGLHPNLRHGAQRHRRSFNRQQLRGHSADENRARVRPYPFINVGQ